MTSLQRELEEVGKRLIDLEHEKRTLLARFRELQLLRRDTEVVVEHVATQRTSTKATKKDWFDRLGFGGV